MFNSVNDHKEEFYEIIIRDRNGRISRSYHGSLFNPLVLSTMGNRIVIKRQGFWNSESYVLGQHETVEAR